MQLPSADHVKRPFTQVDSVEDRPTQPIPSYKGPHSRLLDFRTTGELPGSPLHTDPLPGQMPGTTQQLMLDQPRITRQLTPGSPRITRQLVHEIQAPPQQSSTDLSMPRPSTTRQLTRIPATEKRGTLSPLAPAPRKRHPLIIVSVLLSSIIIFIFTLVFVAPLGIGQRGEGLTEAISQIFSTGSISTFDTTPHTATPTPTPALLTNEGSCNQPSMGLWGTCATAVPTNGVMGTGQMQRPIVGSIITQVFANPEYQSWCLCTRPHTGIDLAAPYNTPILAADSGQVIWTGWDWSGLGWAVKINHGRYISTVYGHLARFVVKVGQNVTKGDLIAYEGSSGASTGPHVHFIVVVNNRWVDPALYTALP